MIPGTFLVKFPLLLNDYLGVDDDDDDDDILPMLNSISQWGLNGLRHSCWKVRESLASRSHWDCAEPALRRAGGLCACHLLLPPRPAAWCTRAAPRLPVLIHRCPSPPPGQRVWLFSTPPPQTQWFSVLFA